MISRVSIIKLATRFRACSPRDRALGFGGSSPARRIPTAIRIAYCNDLIPIHVVRRLVHRVSSLVLSPPKVLNGLSCELSNCTVAAHFAPGAHASLSSVRHERERLHLRGLQLEMRIVQPIFSRRYLCGSGSVLLCLDCGSRLFTLLLQLPV
ncbi:hypothetical protein BC826DRAFT_1044338, partial [Russula brevipes]